ncbi:discoidin domain-containing protein [Skeletonema marinoi]|uniref:Discoidin domain-containing protein n=1 Tax=Skeletonema marinoi TaxID=267567 RepID=A0AAD8YDH3_9STRA|nr:discoidin domain-containing protein [Skeletonema marinoi]
MRPENPCATESVDMNPVDCSALVGGNPSEEGSIEASECPELCAASPCNPINSYCHCGMPSTCKCKPSFTGPDCSVDLCSSASCGEHGSCAAKYLGGVGDVAIDPSFECICESGWFGNKCDVNPCEMGEPSKTCSGNGNCFSLNGIDAECDCGMGYQGNDCEAHNIAYGKASSASSELQPSSRAFDGNIWSRWESAHGLEDTYLEVDLGDVYDIESVNIHWEASSAKRYDIEVSSDGITFASVWSKTDGYANMGSVISMLNGASGRFLRMHAFERTMTYGYSIFEMEVFGVMGPSSPPTHWPTYKAISLAPTVSKVPTLSPITSPPSLSRFEIAREKISSASSVNIAATVAALAFDGNPGTRWESAHGTENVWLQVDLGDVFLVSDVKISWEFACARKYDIELSTDGVSFTSVWSKTDGVGGMGLIDSVFSGTNARFVRMQAFERATQYGYSIWEMEVYGSVSSGPSPPPMMVTPTSLPTPGPSSNPTSPPSPQPTTQAPFNPTSSPSLSHFEIAREKISSASSVNIAATVAALAFDGNPGTRWESAHGTENVWLQVDLGDVFLVSEVKISWEFACARKYDIELSTDGVSFTSVWSKTDGVGGMGLIDSVFSGTNARFVRMQAFERATQYGYSIWEMEVYGSVSSGPSPPPMMVTPTSLPTPGPSSNPTSPPSPQPTTQAPFNPTSSPSLSRFEIAREKISSASSVNIAATVAALAFDGNPGTRWESAHGTENVWLQVDLGDVFLVSEVKISWEFACARKYDIELSTDGVSFTSVWSKTDGVGGMGLIDSVFSGTNARFVRMQAFERATQYGYSIWEMEVYGSVSSGPSPPPMMVTPTSLPTPGPSSNPTSPPSPQPTTQPSPSPTTPQPSSPPTPGPTVEPSSPPTPGPTVKPSLPPTTLAPSKIPTPAPTAPPTTQVSETVFKYVCAKSQPIPSTICADGKIAGGECSTENINNGCGKGGKSCYWASCTDSPPLSLSPVAPSSQPPTPSNCLPLGTTCGQNSDCCGGNCPTKGKNPYQCNPSLRRMQHGIAQKQAKVDNLHKKRREIESTREKTKDGKTQLKLKVERLKKERREKEDKYKETGGSMKKERGHN